MLYRSPTPPLSFSLKGYTLSLNPLRPSLIGLLILLSLGSAQAQDYEPKDVPAVLSQAYKEQGPELAAHLLEPDVVLTMAGYRGALSTNFWTNDPQGLQAAADKFNQHTLEHGFQMIITSDPGENPADVLLIHLGALARLTAVGDPNMVLPYKRSTGWDGFREWQSQQRDYMTAVGDKLPMGQEDKPRDYFAGLLARMPQVVLTTAADDLMLWAACPYSDLLECDNSQYQMPRSLWQDETVTAEQEERSRVLESVYLDPAVKDLLGKADILLSRTQFLTHRQGAPDMGWWSDERGKLGLWLPQEWDSIRRLRASRFSLESWRALQTHAQALQEAALQGKDLADLTKLVDSQSVAEESVRQFALVGEHQSDGAAHQFFAAAQKGGCDWLTAPNAEALFNEGEALFAAGQYEEARAAYAAAAEQRPDIAELIVYQGDCLYRMERIEEAEALFRKAVEMDPKSVLAHRFLAKMLEERFYKEPLNELLEESIKEAQAAVDLAPDDQAARSQLERVKGLKSGS